MNTSMIKTAFQGAKHFIFKNAPTLLTGVGVSGFLTTIGFAIKATFEASDILEAERLKKLNEFKEASGNHQLSLSDQDAGRRLTRQEIFLLTWKLYIPTGLIGIASIGCFIGSNILSNRRQAALAGLYSLTKTMFDEYQQNVVETIGEKKEEKIRERIDQKRLEENPQTNVIITTSGDTTFYDSLSSRYFKSDIETIRQKVNDFNFRLLNDLYRPLNEWYDDIGLPPMRLGEEVGWRSDESVLKIYFDAKLVDNKAVIVINYQPMPIPVL